MKRHRVIMRTKVARRRAQGSLAVFALFGLAVSSAILVRHLGRRLEGFRLPSFSPQIERVKAVVTPKPAPRTPIAIVVSKGKPSGYLADDGTIFLPPTGVFADSKVTVEPGAAAPKDLQGLAAFLKARSVWPSDLSPIAGVEYVSAAAGWRLTLADQTTALWGDWRWPQEKIRRLSQVLADARPRYAKTLSADLRYFEDGRILLKAMDGPAQKF